MYSLLTQYQGRGAIDGGGSSPGSEFVYLRPDGTSLYRRPDGTSKYFRA